MKLLSLFLLVSGWAIVLTAVAVLASPPGRAGFALAGLSVELLGLALMFRCHLARQRD